MRVQFDHLVIGAETLAQGRSWARDALGVDIPDGGVHPLMGTHNLLTRFAGSSPGYLEVIAIDPDAPELGRKRWYGLDHPATQAALAERPQPIAWVIAVEDMAAAVAAARAAGWAPGAILDAERGDLRWRITVPDNGLPPEGVLPTLIEWPGGAAPIDRMRDVGLSLSRILIRHPSPRRIAGLLDALGARDAGVEVALEAGPRRFSAVLGGPV